MHLFSLRPEEFLHDCPYFALWSLDPVISMTSPNLILDILVHERSLSRGVPPSYPPPEQFFNPSTYNFGRYFTAFLLNSGKLWWRSNAAWVVVVHCLSHENQTKKSPPNLLQSAYLVLIGSLALWNISDRQLSFGASVTWPGKGWWSQNEMPLSWGPKHSTG